MLLTVGLSLSWQLTRIIFIKMSSERVALINVEHLGQDGIIFNGHTQHIKHWIASVSVGPAFGIESIANSCFILTYILSCFVCEAIFECCGILQVQVPRLYVCQAISRRNHYHYFRLSFPLSQRKMIPQSHLDWCHSIQPIRRSAYRLQATPWTSTRYHACSL